jgi:hypothetical protein
MILQPVSMGPRSVAPGVLAQPTTRMMAPWTGNVERAALFARSPNICGYQLADARWPMTCPNGQICVYDVMKWLGPYSCAKDSVGNFKADCNSKKLTTCVNYSAVENGYLPRPNDLKPVLVMISVTQFPQTSHKAKRSLTVCSPVSARYCATVLLTISPDQNIAGKYTSFACNTYSGLTSSAEQTT